MRADKVGKAYKRYASESGRLVEWLSFGRLRRHDRVWVLRDVDCSVEPGDALAIVGRNGAGKSTLLRLLAGTLAATEGHVEREGRVAMLELGMRFHPEMSGRENAVAGGQLLGVPAAVVREHLPQIEEFSELGARLDDPLRTYSAGMHLRLAFSVATAVRPDVLLIDEALAVGDAAFQQKCIARIRSFVDAGTAVVLVSHDPVAIRRMCDRAILLEQGGVVQEGLPGAILDLYNARVAQRGVGYEIEQAVPVLPVEGATEGLDDEPLATRSGEGSATLVRIEIGRVGPDGGFEPKREFGVGEAVCIRVVARAERPIDAVTVGIAIRDRFGADVFGTNSHHLGAAAVALDAGQRFRADFSLPLNLGVGAYTLTAALHAGRTHLEGNYDWWDHALSFAVVPSGEPYSVGVAYLPTRVDLRSEDAR